MRTLALVLLLGASMAFVLLGCSDNSAPIVAPRDQGAQVPASLAKSNITNFTFTHSPIGLTGEGTVTLEPGGKWQIKKYGVTEEVNILNPPGIPDPLVSGIMVHYLSATLDATTGEGPVHGSFILTPQSDVGGGVWEGTYEGYRSGTSEPGVFTLPLKVVGHGRGGTIQGMQLNEKSVLTAFGTPPSYWTGVGEGFYKSH
jgi:hypothetical protein